MMEGVMTLKRRLKVIGFFLGLSLLLTGVANASLPDWQERAGEFTVNMGIISSYYPLIDCWKHHSEEAGVVDIRQEKSHHLFFVIREAATGRSIKVEQANLTIHAPSGKRIVSESLHHEINAGTIEYCDFLTFGGEGTYTIELSFVKEGKEYRVNFTLG
jgi:hypothetical protein